MPSRDTLMDSFLSAATSVSATSLYTRDTAPACSLIISRMI